MNQRRMAVIKFLGELYTYQLIEANVIFRTLYTLLTFGYNSQGTVHPPLSIVFTHVHSLLFLLFVCLFVCLLLC